MYGIDLGSRSVKVVQYESPSHVESATYDSVRFLETYLKRNEDKTFSLRKKMLDIPLDVDLVVTGYGKLNLSITDATRISEIKAHTYGALEQTGLDDFTLIDLGGQDSKIIKVEKMKIKEFEMNDKCAASSGRYLENMANILDISVAEMGEYSDNPIDLNSTCAIFGETEVLSKLAEGVARAQIAAAVNKTIVTRIQRHVLRLISDKIVVVGGVATNKAVIKYLKELCGVDVIVPPYPQLNGAIGCAVSKKLS